MWGDADGKEKWHSRFYRCFRESIKDIEKGSTVVSRVQLRYVLLSLNYSLIRLGIKILNGLWPKSDISQAKEIKSLKTLD